MNFRFVVSTLKALTVVNTRKSTSNDIKFENDTDMVMKMETAAVTTCQEISVYTTRTVHI